MIKKNWKEIVVEAYELLRGGMTQKEIALQLGVHPVTLSNKLTAFQEGIDHGKSDKKQNDSIARRELNLTKRRLMVNEMAVILRKDTRDSYFYERFIDEYVIPYLPKTPKFKVVVSKENKGMIEILVGDFHYIDSERSREDIINVFKAIKKETQGFKLIELTLGGDYFENTHHRGQVLEKQSSVMNQIIEVADLIAQGISELPCATMVEMLSGNHDEIRQMGAQSRDDNESATVIIRKILVAGNRRTDVIFNPLDGDGNETIKRNTHYQHGDVIKGDFQQYMSRKILQDSLRFMTINRFISFHSHKYEHIIPKGSDLEFIKVPCVKSWESKWEKDSNQKGTRGFITIVDNVVKLVRL